jgi:hypothetical protein
MMAAEECLDDADRAAASDKNIELRDHSERMGPSVPSTDNYIVQQRGHSAKCCCSIQPGF